MKIDERLSPRSRLLLFQTLELLRKEIQPRFADWKDADDWLFSELDFTKDELAQIYKGRDVLYHDGSAIDFDEVNMIGLRQSSIERFIGHPIFSHEAKAVIDELKVMLGVDALDINEGYTSDAERSDMVRYVERIIREYNLEEAERKIKDGYHGYLDASIPLDSIKLPLDEVIANAYVQAEEKKTWAEEKSEELAAKPKSEWTQDDWEADRYIKQCRAESDYFDSLDDK